MRRPLLVLAFLLALPVALPATPAQGASPATSPGPRAAPAAPLYGVDVLSLRRPAGPEWFGLYLMGKKAGWTRTEVRRERRGGRAVVVTSSETLLQATVGGKFVARHLAEERVYQARPAGRLLEFRGEWSGDGGGRSLAGTCTPAGCTAQLSGTGAARRRDLGAAAETLDQAEGVRLAAARHAAVRGPQLDLEKLAVRELEQRYRGRERLSRAGVEVEVSVVAEAAQGDRLSSEYRVAEDGRILEVRVGDAIVARAEPAAIAMRLEDVDLFSLSRVRLPGPLPRGVPATVIYRLAGLPEAFWKPDERQTFAPGPGGTALLTVRARLPAASDPAQDTPRSTPSPDPGLVAPTPEVDSDDPAVAALAQQVAGHVPGRYAAAVRLSEHVHRRLEKAYGASQDRASDVLRAGKGDCTEHSLLLVALARSLGIPARQVHGLVYAGAAADGDALYWHAWVEVLSADEWIAVDPTLGQQVADATHLALGRGPQVDTAGLLGSLSVEGVEVEPAR